MNIEYPTFGSLVPGQGNFCTWGSYDNTLVTLTGASAQYLDRAGVEKTKNGNLLPGFPADRFGFSFSLVGADAPGTNEEIRVTVRGTTPDPGGGSDLIVSARVTFKLAPPTIPVAPAPPAPPGP